MEPDFAASRDGSGHLSATLSAPPDRPMPHTFAAGTPAVASERRSALVIPPEVRLAALWGDRPRRVSHATALGGVAPHKAGTVSASGPLVSPDDAERLAIDAHFEGSDTLTVRAEQTARHTWISLPDRALLECLEGTAVSDSLVLLAAGVLRDGIGPAPERLALTCRALGFDAALRRLTSLAAMLAGVPERRLGVGHGHTLLADSQVGLLDIIPSWSASPEWIWLSSHAAPQEGASATWADEQCRVLWAEAPDVLAEELLY
ncbi:MAG: hypothetical protein OXG69_09625 [bacterium]|nr:hypothetical protein [bacterium]